MTTVLYLGNLAAGTTSRHRADALRRIGCAVRAHDPYAAMGSALKSRGLATLHFRTGYRLLQRDMQRWSAEALRDALRETRGVDAIWVDSGELFGAEAIKTLKSVSSVPVVLFNHDDPTGARDGRRFDSLLGAVPFYDLIAVCRQINATELLAHGAKDVVVFTRGYDEVGHGMACATTIPAALKSEVAFIGTWMRNEGRDEFLEHLIHKGIPVAIWGDRWEKSSSWRRIRKVYRGGSLYGRDYVAAIQGAKICLGMVSKGNRDLATTRSAEIPYAGGLLCAERTAEHSEMYEEWKEAVFWSSSDECADACAQLLNDDGMRQRIRAAGNERVRQLGIGNESNCSAILRRALK